MPKSKHRKNHSQKVTDYKVNLKITEKIRKKRLMEDYIKMQQDILANAEAHTSTEEVIGPDINVDELNEDWNSVDLNVENVVEPEPDQNDNNNK
jgi:hypothetical protein